jgi:hypothetical protein
MIGSRYYLELIGDATGGCVGLCGDESLDFKCYPNQKWLRWEVN